MPSLREHCWESILRFGDNWIDLHRWLDEFHGVPPYGQRHRRARHHEAGIAEAIRRFGPAAGPVARAHIIADLKQAGWQEGDPFPRDEVEYVAMGWW